MADVIYSVCAAKGSPPRGGATHLAEYLSDRGEVEELRHISHTVKGHLKTILSKTWREQLHARHKDCSGSRPSACLDKALWRNDNAI